MEPVLAQLEKEYEGRVDFRSYNVYEAQEKAGSYDIRYTPTYVFLDADGKEISRLTGQQPADTMRSHIAKTLGD